MLDKTADALSIAHAGRRGVFLREVEIDFSKNNAAAAEVVQALPVAKGEFVERVFMQVKTAEGAVVTIDVGDGADTDGWIVDVDGNAAGYAFSKPSFTLTEGAPNTINKDSAYGFDGGKLYTADDTIDLIPSAAMDTGVVRVMALVSDIAE